MLKNRVYEILEDRAFLYIEGKDSQKFLQSLITNNIYKLEEKKLIYSFMLSPNGKYFCDMFIMIYKGGYLLEVNKNRAEQIIKFLNLTKLRADIKISLINHFAIIVILDNKLDTNLQGQVYFFEDPRSNKLPYRCYISDDKFNHFIDKNQLIKTIKPFYEELRILNVVAEGEKELIAGESFILEYKADIINAVDFNKGCYIGQELISKMRNMGKLKRSTHLIIGESNLDANDKEILYDNNKKLGKINYNYNNYAIGLIRIDEFAKYKTSHAKAKIGNIIVEIK